MGRTGLRLVTLAVVAASVVTACNSDGGSDGDAAPTTLASRESSTTTRGNDEAEVLAAYREFWEVFREASDPMNPQHPRLDDVATGEERRQLGGAFLAHKSAGEVFRGSIELRPEVVSLSAREAVVRDCYLDEIAIHDAETGEVKEPGDDFRTQVRVTLVFEDDRWKVAAIKHEGDECKA